MTFILTPEQLIDIAEGMAREIRKGLAASDGDLLCLPTFILLSDRPDPGNALVIDVGGTHVRCAVVGLAAGHPPAVIQGPVTDKIPARRGAAISGNAFLESLAGVVERLRPPAGLPLGYCFSYPARPTPDGDAVILHWTKELFVEETIGRKAGGMLRDHLRDRFPELAIGEVIVINDTIAALLAGMSVSPTDAPVGLIIGTGTNLALLLPPAHIPKLAGGPYRQTPLPVNLESGNFHPPHLNQWDEALDAASHNPGRQRFEKAVSGYYLPYLFKLACPESDLDPAAGSAPLFARAYPATPPSTTSSETVLARQIIARSADLIAAALAGAAIVLTRDIGAGSIGVTAEGGLFQAHHHYRETINAALRRLLTDLGLSGDLVTMQTVPMANLIGSALAARSMTAKTRQS
jgi:hexokinase